MDWQHPTENGIDKEGLMGKQLNIAHRRRAARIGIDTGTAAVDDGYGRCKA